MLEIGQIVTLSNDKEYIVVNRIKLHNINYVFLISNFKPLDIIVATEKNKDGNLILDEIKDNNELDYILSKFVLTKDDESKFDE